MSVKPASSNRPLSPFMIGPYYKPQLTSMLSITHRLTGLALAAGTVFIAAWLVTAATSAEAFAVFSAVAGSVVGKLITVAYSWAVLYHLCNGIRHLFWDTGRGFDLKSAYASGYAVIGASLVLTAALWTFALVGGA